jgi:hypothetical protein
MSRQKFLELLAEQLPNLFSGIPTEENFSRSDKIFRVSWISARDGKLHGNAMLTAYPAGFEEAYVQLSRDRERVLGESTEPLLFVIEEFRAPVPVG